MSSDIAYILLANRSPLTLAPLSEEIPPALFPFAGRPLIGHWLDFMTMQGMKNINLILHESDYKTAPFVREKWPEVNIGLRNAEADKMPKLIIRADVVPALDSLRHIMGGQHMAHMLRNKQFGRRVMWQNECMDYRLLDDVGIQKGNDLLLPDVGAYMNMSFAAQMGFMDDDLMINATNEACFGKKIYVSKTAHIEDHVELSGHIIIHEGAMVGAHASLENVIVMPGALVEPHTVLANCLIGKEWIYNHEGYSLSRHSLRPVYKISA